MNEFKSFEQEDDGLTPEEREMAAYYLSLCEDSKVERRDCGQEIIDLQNILVLFEEKHSLDELNAILDLTPDEAPDHPVREPARKDLALIVTKLNALEKETNITSEKYSELQNQYRRLSNAVGIINGNKVRHS